VPVSIDQSPPAPTADDPPPYGVLSSYAYGKQALELMRMSEAGRGALWLKELVDRFEDPAAGEPIDFDVTDWGAEQWSQGGMIGHFTPGALTTWGEAYLQPYRRVYW